MQSGVTPELCGPWHKNKTKKKLRFFCVESNGLVQVLGNCDILYNFPKGSFPEGGKQVMCGKGDDNAVSPGHAAYVASGQLCPFLYPLLSASQELSFVTPNPWPRLHPSLAPLLCPVTKESAFSSEHVIISFSQ